MQKQRGGTFLGFVLGLVVGLGIALGVALYVTKVPLPFMSKGQTRSADQNDAETKKNKAHLNPNPSSSTARRGRRRPGRQLAPPPPSR